MPNAEDNYSKAEFDAVLVSHDAAEKGDNTPGHFYYVEDSDGKPAGIISCLPNAQDKGASWGATMFVGYGDDGSQWKWDGNREKPTLTPSIHRTGHWHGWLTRGRFQLKR